MSEIRIKVREALRRYCGSEWIEKTVEDILTIFQHYKEAPPAVTSEAAKGSDVRAACEADWADSTTEIGRWIQARVQAAADEMREECARHCDSRIKGAPTDEAAVAFALAAEEIRALSIPTNAYDAALLRARIDEVRQWLMSEGLDKAVGKGETRDWRCKRMAEMERQLADLTQPAPEKL